ncbi:hypothetical protein ACE3MS_09385 [Paenibacillus dendritiformis]|uniref:hypothetical protein n=1 Tax=Paenibacillus dendritiformis TaxID=130049 RepID=UPI00364D97C8
MNPTKTSVNWVAYIEKFIDAMNEPEESGGTSYFERVHFERYVQSKSEENLVSRKGDRTKQNRKHVTCESVIEEIAKERTTGKGGGYPEKVAAQIVNPLTWHNLSSTPNSAKTPGDRRQPGGSTTK